MHALRPGTLALASLALLGLAAVSPAHAQSPTLISQGKPVTATSFFDNRIGDTFPASNITDGRFDDTGSSDNWSFWLTTEGQLGSATINLGSLYTIDSFQLQDTHNRGNYDRGTNAFDISVSTDGINFTPVVSDSFTTWPNLPIVTESGFAPVDGQYVKFNIDSKYGPGGSSGGLNELQVFGTSAAPVPEASTTVSLGLLLALGLGGVALARKKNAVAQLFGCASCPGFSQRCRGCLAFRLVSCHTEGRTTRRRTADVEGRGSAWKTAYKGR